MLDQVNKTLAKKDITLDVTDVAKELLMEQGMTKLWALVRYAVLWNLKSEIM